MATRKQQVRVRSRRGSFTETPPVPTVLVTTSGQTSATASYTIGYPSPIQPSKSFHLIRLTSTTAKIANSWANKNAGTPVNLTTSSAVLQQTYTSVDWQTSTDGTNWTNQTANPVTLTVPAATTVYARARTYNGTNFSAYGTDDATTDSAPISQVLTVGPGKQFTTITAAVAAAGATANALRTIEVYTGTYNETVVSVRSGTQASPLVLRAAAGETPVITGFANNLGGSGEEASVAMIHNWLDWGEGIEIRGNNTGSAASFTTANPDHGVVYRAVNNIARFKIRGMKLSGFWVRPSVAGGPIVIDGADVEVVGTLDRGTTPIADAGEGYRVEERHAAPLLLKNFRGHTGGHSACRPAANTQLIRRGFTDNTGFAGFTFGGQTGYRGKSMILVNSDTRTVVEETINQGSGVSYDNGSTPMVRVSVFNPAFRRIFFFDYNGQGSGGGCAFGPISSDAVGINCQQVRVAHATFFQCTSAPISMLDNLGTNSPAFGPFYYKNIIFRNCGVSSFNNQSNCGIALRYRSSRVATNKNDYWKTLFFIDGLVADYDPDVLIRDLDGVVAQIKIPLSTIAATYPANFQNITTGVNPTFVSQTRPAAALSQADAWTLATTNFVPQHVSCVGTGRPLTTVTATINNQTTVPVQDSRWFRDAMGFTGEVGDTVTFTGGITRTITSIPGVNSIVVTPAVSLPQNAGVFLGASATPNMGAV